VEWASLKTDASVYALEAAGLQALSLAAGDVVVLPSFFGDKPIYMNLYIMLVGPSTTMRKTTVLGYIEGLLPVNELNGQPFVRVLDDVSIQAFNRELAEAGSAQAPVLLSVDEVAGLFQLVRNRGGSYLAGFDKTLMKAYDHSSVHIARVGRNIDSETGAFVNVFAASTPEPLVEVLGQDDIESGLLPRFLIFDVREAQRGERVPLGKRLADHEAWLDKRQELQLHLASIAQDRASGVPSNVDNGKASFPVTVVQFDPDAIERLDNLDAEFSRSVLSEDTAIGAIKGRAFWHIVKVAGLYAISRGGKEATVQLIDVLRAMHLIETTIGDLVKMRNEVGSTLMERRIKEIETALTASRRKQMKRSTLVRKLKLTAFELRQVQETLLVRNHISLDKAGDGEVLWTWKG
jgi:hypothetical protein